MSSRFLFALSLCACFAFAQDAQQQTKDQPTHHFCKDITPPRAKHVPEPAFSEEARRKHVEGVVLLELVVGADGRPQDIRVVRGIGYGLDEQAVKAVRTWRFEPATRISDGGPIACPVSVEVNFRLLK